MFGNQKWKSTMKWIMVDVLSHFRIKFLAWWIYHRVLHQFKPNRTSFEKFLQKSKRNHFQKFFFVLEMLPVNWINMLYCCVVSGIWLLTADNSFWNDATCDMRYSSQSQIEYFVRFFPNIKPSSIFNMQTISETTLNWHIVMMLYPIWRMRK